MGIGLTRGLRVCAFALFVVSMGCDFRASTGVTYKSEHLASSEPTAATPSPSPTVLQANYYVAPNGNDSGSGSMSAPFATLNKLWTVIAPGDLVYVRGGTYNVTTQQYLVGKNGTAGKPIRIWAYPGETPKFVKSANYTNPRETKGGTYFSGNYFHFKGLEYSGFVQQDGYVWFTFFIYNLSHNVFEKFDLHHGSGGMYLNGSSTDNLILNVDSHHHHDPFTDGQNADGFALGYIPEGSVNRVVGCRSWMNSDDGYDLWQNNGTVIFENNWAFKNGYYGGENNGTPGDGNGFKLGGTGDYKNQVLRILKNNIAFDNKLRGFDKNGMSMAATVYNNIAYNNGAAAYDLTNDSVHTVKNNIAFNNAASAGISSVSIVSNNSWNLAKAVTASDFLSLDSTGTDAPRNADGSLVKTKFLRLAPTSSLIDGGVDVGAPFSGAAPDLGPFE